MKVPLLVPDSDGGADSSLQDFDSSICLHGAFEREIPSVST